MENLDQIALAFGKTRIPIRADPKLATWKIIRPSFQRALPNAKEIFQTACRRPIKHAPLRDTIQPTDRVVIVTSDGTRAVPNRLLIPWILEELRVPIQQVTILLENGSHRANTTEELAGMFGRELVSKMQILNHDAYDPKRNSWLGQTSQGTDVYLDKIYLEAEKRIVMGFVEPHFFAGFSGGAKGIAPGVASIETILHLHRAELIADPMSTWGVLDENPIQREIAEAVALCPPDFLVNVTLNSDQAITEFYLGDYREAHRQGCASVKELSMVAVDERFPLVITSNSGFPLDQNLYQTVKGMSAAERIVETGGTILVTSECRDGLPDHGNFSKIMQKGSSPEDVLKWISALDQPILDQWQAQILAGILQRANVAVYSRVKETELCGCKLSVIKDLQKTLQEKIQELGNGDRVAVLPNGPLTIPYLT